MPIQSGQQATHRLPHGVEEAERNARVLAEREESMREILRQGGASLLRCPSCDNIMVAMPDHEGYFVCWAMVCPRYDDEFTRSEIENAAELAGTRRLEEAANPDNASSPEFERAEMIDAGRRIR